MRKKIRLKCLPNAFSKDVFSEAAHDSYEGHVVSHQKLFEDKILFNT